MKKIINFDDKITKFFNEKIRTPVLDIIMRFITGLGNAGLVWVIISLYLIFVQNRKRDGAMLLSSIIVTTIVGEGIIKNIFKRARPCRDIPSEKMLIKKPLTYSFPSGHTASSFAAMNILIYIWPALSIVWIILALLISVSRIYLNVHYTTDVVVGACLGMICSECVKVVFA